MSAEMTEARAMEIVKQEAPFIRTPQGALEWFADTINNNEPVSEKLYSAWFFLDCAYRDCKKKKNPKRKERKKSERERRKKRNT